MTKNINYLQFLEIISGAKQFEKYTFVIAKDFEITGTIEQLEAVADNTNFNELKRQINKLSKKASKEITETEIIKYLKDLTNDFDTELVRAALKELEIFTSKFNETLFNEAKEYYILNNKKIPTYTKVGKDKKAVTFENQDEMINEVFPFQKWNLSTAKNWLESKLDKNSNNIPTAKNEAELPKKLEDFLNHEKSSEILKMIKTTYKGIKGKKLRFLHIALCETFIDSPNLNLFKFHKLCKNEFDWNVGTYNALNVCKEPTKIDSIDRQVVEKMKTAIEKSKQNH